MITRLKPTVHRLAGLNAFLLVASGIGLSQGPAKDPGVRAYMATDLLCKRLCIRSVEQLDGL